MHPQFPSLTNIQKELLEASKSDQPPLRLAVLRNIVTEPIEPYLNYLAHQANLQAAIRFGEYDQMMQETTGGAASWLQNEWDGLLVFLHLETATTLLTRSFAALNDSGIQDEIERLSLLIQTMLQGIRKLTGAMVLWQGFETPVYPALGIWDSQQKTGQAQAIQELNQQLQQILRTTSSAYYVDLPSCALRLGALQFYDQRSWHLNRSPYSRAGWQHIAYENFKYLRSVQGKAKKCLVLDCDNTLWGGIVGEEGISGIHLGNAYPGSPYREFQQAILDLYHRGVILALCSKNNTDDVWEVFHRHPDMVLREEHIAASRINWQDKAQNLREIAGELNIGLDSLVFVDDNQFEIELVQHELPEVTTVHIPTNEAIHACQHLASGAWFDTLTLSQEDRQRGAMYQAEHHRQTLKTQSSDLESYYRSLEMVVDIQMVDELTVPRVAQQTQKTNQFNLTTRRYEESDILQFIENPNSDAFCLRLHDRFGDSGIVGTAILRYQADQVYVDTFLLSCRVLGRGVESAFLNSLLKFSHAQGYREVIGEYLKTPKNAQVEPFYAKEGFVEIETERTDERRLFLWNTSQPLQQILSYFVKIIFPSA